MKKLIIIVLIFISSNLFAHDFVWGVNLNNFIRETGEPYRINDLSSMNRIVLIYRFTTFDRSYIFNNNILSNVQDLYGPFNNLDEAFELFNMLYSRLDKIYEVIDYDENVGDSNSRVTITYNYGSDRIDLRMDVDQKTGRPSIRIFINYFSPLFFKDAENEIRDLLR